MCVYCTHTINREIGSVQDQTVGDMTAQDLRRGYVHMFGCAHSFRVWLDAWLGCVPLA
jgi:hypothetical protein